MERQYDDLARDDDEDDISLAKCMTRKLRWNEQMSPGMALQHQQHVSPTTRDSSYAINKYPYSQYHQLQLQLQFQQQLMLQYQQQQQQQQNLIGYNGRLLGQQHHLYHRHQQQNIALKPQPIMKKSQSTQLDANHNPKTGMSPASSSHRVSWSSFHNTPLSKKNSLHQRNSLLSLQSDGMTKNHHSQLGSRLGHQHRLDIDPSNQKTNHRLSIYSHASGNSTSTTASERSRSSESTSTSKNYSKPSLTKRIRGVIMGKNINKQAPTAASSSLQRSSSVPSHTSSVVTTKTSDNEDKSPRSLWITLLRKSSRSRPTNPDPGKQQVVHGKRSNGRKDVVPDSPASSVSGGSYHRSFLRQENYFDDGLPSPASSTSPESPLNYPTDHRHPESLKTFERNGQLDYFGQSPPTSQQRQKKSNPYTCLQHVSPKLRPSSHNQQSGISQLMVESDDLPASFLDTFIASNNNPVMALPPISPSSSASSASTSTSTSTLALDNQQNGNIKPAIKSFSTKPNTKIQFATTIQVHDTFGSQDYDRRCDTQVTCQRLTIVLALQIKKELNEYKLNEMQVHHQSRKNTQFFF